MTHDDEKLRAALKRWRDIEPQANFEANVWRQIRQAKAKPSERLTIAEWLGRLMPRPVLAMTAAVVASAIVGSSAGLLSMRGRTMVPPGELQFLGSGTLAGGYVKLTTRRTP